jgi:hypothetical protein
MKENIYGNKVFVDLKIPEIKLFIAESLGEDFKNQKFKFNKSDFTFRRGNKKDLQEIYFRFISSAPLNFKIKFSLRTLNSEIELVKSNFSIKYKTELADFATMQIFMGDFLDEGVILRMVNKWNGLVYDKSKNEFVKDDSTSEIKILTRTQISGFQYEIYDSKDIMEFAADIKRLFIEKVFPLCNQLCTIDGIDRFFESKSLFSVNSLRQNNFEVELIAAKLAGRRDLSTTYERVKILVDNGITLGILDSTVGSYIDMLYKYLK